MEWLIRNNKYINSNKFCILILLNARSFEGEGGGGVGQVDLPPLDFFGFKFLLLNRLSKALAQLFIVCEHIF